MLQTISSPRGEAASPPLKDVLPSKKAVTVTSLQLHIVSYSYTRYHAVTRRTPYYLIFKRRGSFEEVGLKWGGNDVVSGSTVGRRSYRRGKEWAGIGQR
jgi:hypothetical protein